MQIQKLNDLFVYDLELKNAVDNLANGQTLYLEAITEKEFISRQYRAYYFAVVVKAFINTFGSIQEAHEKLGERFLRRRLFINLLKVIHLKTLNQLMIKNFI